MILFSTKLNITEMMSVDDFISLVIEWNRGSGDKHPENVVPNMDWNGEHNIRFGNDKLWMDIQEYRNKNIVAVRYEKQEENGVVWDTDYVMNFDTHKLAIRLDRSYTEDAMVLDTAFSTPFFISLLIDRGYVQDDGVLPVLHNHIYLTNENMMLLTDIVSVKTEYQLPVVYVSKTEYDTDPVNIFELAWKLKGGAHVLVQKSKLMNDSLIAQCGQPIETNGDIGIYFPKQTLTPRRLHYRGLSTYDNKLQETIVNIVMRYCNAQMVSPLYTWMGVNNALLQDRLKSQLEKREAAENRAKSVLLEIYAVEMRYNKERADIEKKAQENAKAIADSILDEFQDEVDRYKEQIKRLTDEVNHLTSDNYGLRNKLSCIGAEPLLYLGDREQDYYPGEIKDLVISTLVKGLNSVPPDSRRYDVVNDVINSNDFLETSDKRANEVKRLIGSSARMTPKIRSGLVEKGFVITEEGKHHKAKYYGDDRYIVIFGKTPSDGKRSGANNAAEVIRKVY